MEIQTIVDMLGRDNRVFGMSVVFATPMTYLNCWLLFASFSGLELLPQLILSFAVATVLVAVAAVSQWAAVFIAKTSQYLYYRFVLFPIVLTTAIVLVWPTMGRWFFMGIYLALCVVEFLLLRRVFHPRFFAMFMREFGRFPF